MHSRIVAIDANGAASVFHVGGSDTEYVAVSSSGEVFALEDGGFVSVFMPNGSLVDSWHPKSVLTQSNDEEQFEDISVDSAGHVALTGDTALVKVAGGPGPVFVSFSDSSGNGSSTIFVTPPDGYLGAPGPLGFGPDGRLYVLDEDSWTVDVYASDGTWLTSWRPGDWPSERIANLAVSPGGKVYLAEEPVLGSKVVTGVGRYTPEGTLLSRWPYPIGEYNLSGPFAVNASGDLWSDSPQGSFVEYSATGALLRRSPALSYLSDAAFDPSTGDIIIVAFGEVTRVSPAMRILDHWSFVKYGATSGFKPFAVAVGVGGRIYVAYHVYPHPNGDQVGGCLEYSPVGRLLARWSSFGPRPGQILASEGIAESSTGVYVSAGTSISRFARS